MRKSILFDGSLSIDVRSETDMTYSSIFINPVSYERITVVADASYGSSMDDIIDSLIVELEKYKEDLKDE